MRLISQRMAAATLLLLVVSTAAHAQKIKVEFDKNVDFAKFTTYAWDPTPQATSKPVLVANIKAAISQELTKRGLKEVAADANPDLYVAMYGGIGTDMAVTYSDFYYGPSGIPPFGTSFVMWGTAPGTTNSAVFNNGLLVVEIIDATHKKLAWRGMATQKLSSQQMKAAGAGEYGSRQDVRAVSAEEVEASYASTPAGCAFLRMGVGSAEGSSSSGADSWA